MTKVHTVGLDAVTAFCDECVTLLLRVFVCVIVFVSVLLCGLVCVSVLLCVMV